MRAAGRPSPSVKGNKRQGYMFNKRAAPAVPTPALTSTRIELNMKTHAIGPVLVNHKLRLRESVKAVWTGGLTTVVVYTVLDEAGGSLAEARFGFNRHPGCYVRQGCEARKGTARHAALDQLMASMLERLGRRRDKSVAC